MAITGTHDFILVALSILIATAASYTALDLAGRVKAAAGWTRRAWLATAALTMGGGVWAMHFVAMLAYTIPQIHVGYDLWLTLLSLVVPVAGTGISFEIMSLSRRHRMLLPISGLVMGPSILAMHYLGMAAMKMAADLTYDRGWIALSVLIAIGAASAALWLSVRTSSLPERIGAAVMMGIAVSGMHYTAMQAATFKSLPSLDMTHDAPGVDQVALAIAVAAAAFLILFLALIAAMVDRRMAALIEREAQVLRQSEEKFRSLYKRTPLPLYTLDQHACIENVSDAWLEMMGYRREEVAGKPLVSFMNETSGQRAAGDDWSILLRHGEFKDVPYRVVTKDGGILDVIASARVERDDRGGFAHVLAGMTNVTERIRAEEALRQSQKIEVIGQLTGGVAHDFNNLLAVIMGNLEMLRKRLPDDPKLTRLVDNALQGVQRGASLTQRLLAFARRQDLRPEPVDVPALVRGMADLLQRSLGSIVQVETHFPLKLPEAHVDANQLELALLNLALNARDAMPDGGTLTISAFEQPVPAVNVVGLQPGSYVCLCLTDTGSGMDPETLARATEPFFTTKGMGKGTGLGLSMVQGMAAQSGVRLILSSEIGHGTTAELWLPVAQPKISEERLATVPADLSSANAPPALTVLVVDDDPLVLANTATMLEDLGHSVLQAPSGQEALTLLRVPVNQVDLMITDQAMPGMTGLRLAEIVNVERPDLPILLVTGYAELPAGAEVRFSKLGKPFDQAALARVIAELVPEAPEANVVRLRPDPQQPSAA